MTSKEYELFVKKFFMQLNRQSNIIYSDYHHNKRFIGKSTRTWDVDVSFSFMANQLKHRVFIECKNWNKKVDASVISLLKQCLDDCNIHKGVVVTTVGFQEGAVKAAEILGIGLLILKDYNTPEWIHHLEENLDFKEANTDSCVYTELENEKIISGFIKPNADFLSYAKNRFTEDIYQMFVKKEFLPLFHLDNTIQLSTINSILSVISDYEKIETCGLPFHISQDSYIEGLSALYLIKANYDLAS
jgi:hypothetical protein